MAHEMTDAERWAAECRVARMDQQYEVEVGKLVREAHALIRAAWEVGIEHERTAHHDEDIADETVDGISREAAYLYAANLAAEGILFILGGSTAHAAAQLQAAANVLRVEVPQLEG